jgi:branched-chain amino acid transport system permease protein
MLLPSFPRPPVHHPRQLRQWARVLSVALAFLLVLVGPLYLSPYGIVLAFSLFVYITLAQAWNLVGGYGGQFSLAHAMFVGIGSYATAVLLIHTRVPLAAAIVLSGMCAGVVATITGLPLFRLRGHYFAVASLGVALAAQAWMVNWSYTGASSGLTLPDRALLDGITQYYMAAGLMILTLLCVAVVARSRFGLRLLAIRDNEDAAAELGVRVLAVKLGAFVLSAFFVGVVGALVAVQNLSIEPNSAFSLTWTITMIVMAVTGGLATLIGPIIGAVVIYAIQQQFQDYGSWSTLFTGGALVLIVVVAPAGLWGTIRAGTQRLSRVSPFRHLSL